MDAGVNAGGGRGSGGWPKEMVNEGVKMDKREKNASASHDECWRMLRCGR